jgi:RNA polymerase sigma-70 factor (ECF subfamily)
MTDDKKLVRRFLEGDRQAFGSLVDRYQKMVYNVALRMANDPDDAKDISQNVFIRVSEKLESFDPKYKFFSWLYRISVNESINFLQSRKQNETLPVEIVAPGKGPEELLQDQQLSASVEDGLMKLSHDYRIVIILRHFEGLSYEEIGFILDLSAGTVKSRLFSARQSLKKILSPGFAS